MGRILKIQSGREGWRQGERGGRDGGRREGEREGGMGEEGEGR